MSAASIRTAGRHERPLPARCRSGNTRCRLTGARETFDSVGALATLCSGKPGMCQRPSVACIGGANLADAHDELLDLVGASSASSSSAVPGALHRLRPGSSRASSRPRRPTGEAPGPELRCGPGSSRRVVPRPRWHADDWRAPLITTPALMADHADAPLRRVVIERREPGQDDVLIEIRYTGVSHADLMQWRKQVGAGIFPTVPGHEITGVVAAVGPGVASYQSGDRVGVGLFVDSCGECQYCMAGREQFCARGVVPTASSPVAARGPHSGRPGNTGSRPSAADAPRVRTVPAPRIGVDHIVQAWGPRVACLWRAP
jgi:Alcohol dehydrogenase GroES-like domain